MLRKLTILVLAIVVLACNHKEKSRDIIFYKKDLQRSINFFNVAYDSSKGAYYSELNFQGELTSEKIYTVALSRLIYGLSYASQFYPEDINRAKASVRYQLDNMIAKDSMGLFFLPEIENDSATIPTQLDIWQQAYGLCGLTEYYRLSKDELVLDKIHQLHSALYSRFRDSVSGGFYGDYSITEGAMSGSKSIQSLMYPLTAYIINLWEADVKNRNSYEAILTEHLEIAYQNVWNDSLGWVNVKLGDDWKPKYEIKENAFVTVGHNFQLAALLLRASKWPFLDAQTQQEYKLLGEHIIDITMSKNIWHNGVIKEGFYAGFNPFTNKIKDTNRTWWQHSEAIIALSLCGDQYKSELDQLIGFYYQSFVDTNNGGEIFNVNKNGEPVIEPKGQKGKSVYHHLEMLRFLIEANS